MRPLGLPIVALTLAATLALAAAAGADTGSGTSAAESASPSPAPETEVVPATRSYWWTSHEDEVLRMLQDAGLASEGTLVDALADLELPFAFAGREQWVRNLAGVGVEDEPRLWDVSMESIVEDENAFRLLVSRTMTVREERGLQAALDDVSYWRSLVPEWAPRVRDELAAEGIPFSVELLASPGIELHDPAKPLFAKGESPSSLVGLGVLQKGESAFLRSLSAEELLREIWPLYWRYYHRPAGAAVPADLAAGLTFGTPVREACFENTANGCINGVRYRRSAVMEGDLYRRWLAYGMPGAAGDGQHNGYVVDEGIGWAYNPTTGEFFHLGGGYDHYRQMWLELLQSGAIRPEHFITPWEEVVVSGLGSRIAAAGFLRDPSIWFAGPNASYAPEMLPSGTLARYLALVVGS